MDKRAGSILFTAFEPSGDDLGAAVVRVLRQRRPELEIYAWGGAKMKAAGATVVERTGEDAIVGLPGPGKILDHFKMNKRIAKWMDEHDVSLHVPVDSPAANFPICKLAKHRGIRVVHLAAPQLWAWAPWRIHKLKRLTDRVLCLLPFEEEWFEKRGAPATFIGHPLFDQLPNGDLSPVHKQGVKAAQSPAREQGVVPDPSHSAATTPSAPLRLAVMPGSRPKELERHLPLMLDVLDQLGRDRLGLEIQFAVKDEASADRVQEIADRHGGLPAGAKLIAGEHAVAEVAAWADVCLTKSGTVTLHIVRERTPMVVMYRTFTLGYQLIGRWLITSPFSAMPNLIAGRRIVEEFVPHIGGPASIVAAVAALLDDAELRDRVKSDLDEVAKQFEGRSAAANAVDAIEKMIDRR